MKFRIQLQPVDPEDIVEAESVEEAKQIYMDQFGILGSKKPFITAEEYIEPGKEPKEPDDDPEDTDSEDED